MLRAFAGPLLSRSSRTSSRIAPSGIRAFSAYEGQEVSDAQLIKKSDDWAIEETNFCFGRKGPPRYKATDDQARRTLYLMDTQLCRMHTRLRDGTVIPYMNFELTWMNDVPVPEHTYVEKPIIKYTWDETYDDAWEDAPSAPKAQAAPASKIAATPAAKPIAQ
eukprot:GDKH01015802.1.p1 GENE.GDKH01015802.1~~GDKH01015802.1.p1  ORF type:complete len:163 (+),score=14.94 GDKH01015802.1:151-639(+)